MTIRPALAQSPAPALQAEVVAGAYQELPPVKLYPTGAQDFRDWPGLLTGTSEVTNRQGNDTKYYNVSDPSYFPFIPAAARNTRTAVIVAPGGGFRMLSWDSEGTLVAKWLAERGIAAFVLKYRLIQQAGPNYGSNARRDEPALTTDVAGAPGVADGTAAIRAIRARAAEYAIDPNKIVFIGFSAGAHVASYQALNPDLAARPNFVAPIYGAPAGVMPAIPAANSPAALPPIFLAVAQNDPLAGTMARNFYDALYAAGYRPEFHLFLNGGHGFGMNPTRNTSRHFIDEFYWWMESLGLTRKPGDPDMAAPTRAAGPGRGGLR